MHLYTYANYITNCLQKNNTKADVSKSNFVIESNNDCNEEITNTINLDLATISSNEQCTQNLLALSVNVTEATIEVHYEKSDGQ